MRLALTFALDLLALHVGDQEGADEILDDDLGLVVFLLHLIEEVVDGGDLQLGFLVGLQRGGVVDGLHDDALQVGVHTALVHLHKLPVKHVLPVAQHLLGLPLARLLGFALAAFVLGETHHGVNLALLLQAHQFLREAVHRLGDD